MHLKYLSPFLAVSLLASGSMSCRGLERGYDCDEQADNLTMALAERGKLKETIPDRGPYPMLMAMSEDGVNQMVAGQLGGALNLNVEQRIGPMLISFTTLGEPELILEHVAGCETCFRMHLEYDINVLLDDMGIINGIGETDVAVPLRVEKDGQDSLLIAGFDEGIFANFQITIAGVDLDQYTQIRDFVRDQVYDAFNAGLGPMTLLRLAPFSLGDGDILMKARQPFVNPDEKSIVLGVATNLDIPLGIGLDTKVAVSDKAPMVIKFHSDIFQEMARRLLREGTIPRSYNENGDPSPEGEFAASIEKLEAEPADGNNPLATLFRVWRTTGEYCGYAEVDMPLFLELNAGIINVRPGNVEVVDGEGVGAVALEDENLVEENTKLVSNFKQSLADQVSLTVNYNDISLDGDSVLILQTKEVDTDTKVVDVLMDFDIVPAN